MNGRRIGPAVGLPMSQRRRDGLRRCRPSRPVVGSRLAGLSIPIPRIGANEAIEFAPRACEPGFAARRRGMNGAFHRRRQYTGYMAGVSAEFKAFEEATSGAVMTKGFLWRSKIAAGFTNSGAHAGDKLSMLMQLVLFAARYGMHWVNLGLPPANDSTAGSPAELNRLGFGLGAGAQSNTDQGLDAAPPEQSGQSE